MEWVQIFPSATVARERITENKPQLLVVHGKRICIVLLDARFYAVQDHCTHSNESLSRGNVNYLGELICPGHGYCFNIKTGREASERSVDLETYPVKEDATGFYVGI